MSDEFSRGGFEANDLATRSYVDAAVAGAGGGGATLSVQQSLYLGGSVAFGQELWINNGAFSYSQGSVAAFYSLPFDSTIQKIWGSISSSVGVDLTLRLRNGAGTQLWTGTLTAGSTSFSASLSLSVPVGTQLWFSVAPATGTPTITNTYCNSLGVL